MKLFLLSGSVLERWVGSRDQNIFSLNQNRTSDSGLTNQTRAHFWLSACFDRTFGSILAIFWLQFTIQPDTGVNFGLHLCLILDNPASRRTMSLILLPPKILAFTSTSTISSPREVITSDSKTSCPITSYSARSLVATTFPRKIKMKSLVGNLVSTCLHMKSPCPSCGIELPNLV
jgi:hypothetical protein